jgi:hypothetical protein
LGGETVEVLITLVLFFLLVLTIIEFSIVVFDKGVVASAARVGARQGSLYWIDPSNYDPDDSKNNIRIRESMISSAVDQYLDVLIQPHATGASPQYSAQGFNKNGAAASATFDENTLPEVYCDQGLCAGDADVAVAIQYNYDGAGVTAVPWIPGIGLDVTSGSATEADF